MQLIGQGAHGPQAAQAIRHFAAQNGVWSLGNFGGVPPKSAMNFTQADGSGKSNTAAPDAAKSEEPLSSSSTDSNAFQQNKVEPSEYRFIFNSCGVGMAIASMGGAFVDCNQLFCQLSSYSKQEVCGMTIFNMTARSDLQRAFDQISQLISPPIDDIAQSTDQPGGSERQPVTFRGSLRHRDDLGLCVSLVKGEDGVSKCFCVSLVKNPTSPFENSQPVAASFESILSNTTPSQDMATEKSAPANASPAFTSG
jgi:PAS domain S-box-containing protein